MCWSSPRVPEEKNASDWANAGGDVEASVVIKRMAGKAAVAGDVFISIFLLVATIPDLKNATGRTDKMDTAAAT